MMHQASAIFRQLLVAVSVIAAAVGCGKAIVCLDNRRAVRHAERPRRKEPLPWL